MADFRFKRIIAIASDDDDVLEDSSSASDDDELEELKALEFIITCRNCIQNYEENKQMKAYIVRFICDDTVSEIPSQWLIDSTHCWWPSKTRNPGNLMGERAVPTANGNFEIFEVEIEKECSTLLSARKYLNDETYKTTDAEGTSSGRGKRKKKKRHFPDAGNFSSSENEEREYTPPPKLHVEDKLRDTPLFTDFPSEVHNVTPRLASVSPRRTNVSPRRASVSPSRASVSPSRDNGSPRRNSVSLRRDSVSPRRDSVSPRRDSVSPRRDSVSPCDDGASRSRERVSPRHINTPSRQNVGSPCLSVSRRHHITHSQRKSVSSCGRTDASSCQRVTFPRRVSLLRDHQISSPSQDSIISPSPSPSITDVSSPPGTPANSNDTPILNKILSTCASIKIGMIDIDRRLKKIEEIRNNSHQQPQDFSELDRYIPVNSVDEIKRLENFIRKESNLFKEFVKSIGGRDGRDYCQRVLKKVFTNKVAVNCSWLGQRNNFRICDLACILNIKRVIFSQCKNMNEVQFEHTMSEWFRQAKLRHSREMKKQSV